jgi:hypothetical protein
MSSASETERRRQTWEAESEREAVIGGVVDLVLAVGSHFRSCAECGAPFVARKRQEYCSTACSQRKRDRRKRSRSVVRQL